ncbi:MAG: cation acetate symporter [Planctomycetaceae bacterium]|nr:cation acetate symporter [Planctomycetaceae bacterium]
MIYETSTLAIVVFAAFVGAVLALSFWLGSRARTSGGYFAAHGQVGWFVNGIAFAGDYLSAASFLGICGMIAFFGYDGFLYSIGYLAGWIVALFVIAEPIKRLGKYTLADALNAKFQSRGVKLVAAVSTLVISLFYLIPQMVGAGALVKPLLGLPHWAGVAMVGATVTLIVATAGMVSTTWVQFVKGTLLVVICGVVVALLLERGFAVPSTPIPADAVQRIEKSADGTSVNGAPISATNQLDSRLRAAHGTGFGSVAALPDGAAATGPLGPIAYIETFAGSTITTWQKGTGATGETTFTPIERKGSDLLLPGANPTFKGVRDDRTWLKLDFISLMLALFLGTASLPHILIRYYTVKDAAAARKSTVVGIGAIGAFYVLTLYLGIGAMTSGALDPTDSNMAAPLLARTFGEGLFAVISAVAFTTVLGTVSGLVMAGAGAVAHDLMKDVFRVQLDDRGQVRWGRIAAASLGLGSIALGIAFEKMNVTFLVGWAFNIAASANLPALVMLLFWKRTTKEGVIAAMSVGLIASLAWILCSADTLEKVYGYSAADAVASALVPFSQPAIVTVPLGFATLVAVSLFSARSARPRTPVAVA